MMLLTCNWCVVLHYGFDDDEYVDNGSWAEAVFYDVRPGERLQDYPRPSWSEQRVGLYWNFAAEAPEAVGQ